MVAQAELTKIDRSKINTCLMNSGIFIISKDSEFNPNLKHPKKDQVYSARVQNPSQTQRVFQDCYESSK